MQSIKPSLPISSSLKNNPVLDPNDGIFGKTGNPTTGQSSLIPEISNATSTANALDAIVTYLEEGNTNFTLGVLTATTTPLPFIGMIYDNGINDDGVGATLTSTDVTLLTAISGHTLDVNHRILITTEGLNGIPITDLRNGNPIANNDICNGIYNVVEFTPNFKLIRSIDSDLASYFNNTSVIILKGNEVGKLYNVRFNPTIGLGSYNLGYDPLIFDNINLGSTANPSSGINSVNTVTVTALPLYIVSPDNTSIVAVPSFPLPAFINGVALEVNQRLLFNNGIDPRHNGVYTVTQKTSPFILTRSADFVAYNNTSLFISDGNDAGSTAYVNFDAGVGLNPFVLGTDPITFTVVAGSGIVGVPTDPPLGDGVNNILNIAGINSTDTIADGFDKTIMSLDHLANKIEPLPTFTQYVRGDVGQNKPKLLTPTMNKIFTMPDQSYTVILNNPNATLLSNTFDVVSTDAYIGLTNLQFQLANESYQKNSGIGPYNVNTENSSNYNDLSRYPSIGPFVRSLTDAITVGSRFNGSSLNAETITLDDTTIANKNGLNIFTFSTGDIRILEMGHLNDYYNNISNTFSKTRSIALDFNYNKVPLFMELANFVTADPINNYNFVSMASNEFSTAPFNFEARFFNYSGTRPAPSINAVSVVELIADPITDADMYISGIPRMKHETVLPLSFTLQNVIDKYLIPGPDTTSINDTLQKLNKLNYAVPSSAKYNLAGVGNSRTIYEPFPEKELQATADETNTLMKNLKINYGHIFECYFNDTELFTNDVFLNTDILINGDAFLADGVLVTNVLSGGKAGTELWNYPNNITIGDVNNLESSNGLYKLITKIVPASSGKDFFYLPNQVGVKCKTRRWDNTYFPAGNLYNNFASYNLPILVDTRSFKATNVIVTDIDNNTITINSTSFVYKANVIYERSQSASIVRVAGSGASITDLPAGQSLVDTREVTSVPYNSTISINIDSVLPYSRDLLFMNGKYQYPLGDFTALYPSVPLGNNRNFTVPAVIYKRYATFLVKTDNPINNTVCLRNVSSLILEIINYNSDTNTYESTGLIGANGVVTNPDFDMYIMFINDTSAGHICERSKGSIAINQATETSVWINANKFYNNSIDNCVDESYANTADRKRLTFGLNRFSGDLLIRIGMSQNTGCTFSGISVTSFA